LKFTHILLLIILLLLALPAGCTTENSVPPSPTVTQAKTVSPSPVPSNTSIKTIDPSSGNSKPSNSAAVPGITCQTVKAKLEKGNSFLLLDVRNKAEFNSEHIDTAVSVPILDLPNQVDALASSLEIVVYSKCS
jgi:hypothetical protein